MDQALAMLRRIMRLPAGIAAVRDRWLPRRIPGYPLLVAAAGVILAIWLYWMAHEVLRGIGSYDFSTYYAAARALRLDPHTNIYSQSVLDASAAAGHVKLQPPMPYTYPPLPAMLLAPLTLLPFADAVHAWEAINLALWLAATLLLAFEVRAVLAPVLGRMGTTGGRSANGQARRGSAGETGLVPTHGNGMAKSSKAWGAASSGAWYRQLSHPAFAVSLALALLICLTWAPAADTVAFGQINFLVLLPLVLVPGLLRRQLDGWAGVALGFATMIKLTPVLLLVYLALSGRWRALLAALATLAALALVTVAVVGPQVAASALPQAARVSAYDTSLGQNEALLGAVTLALLASAPHAAGLIRALEYTLLAGLAVTVGVVLWLRLREAPRDSRSGFTEHDALAYAAALCGFVLVSPLAWLHHYLWVLPAAVLVLAVSIRARLEAPPARKRRTAIRLALTILATLLTGLVLPIGWDHTPWLATSHLLGLPLGNWLREIRPIGTLLLLILALTGLRASSDNRGRSAAPGRALATSLARLPRIPYTVGGRRQSRSGR